MRIVAVLLVAAVALAVTVSGEEDSGELPSASLSTTQDVPCEPTRGSGTMENPYIFETKVDYFASSTGYYFFEGCAASRPTLTMKAGAYYRFVQEDETNWMHPLGFAYLPDGAHKDVDELELEVRPPGGSACGSDCQHPRYFGGKNGDVFLGGSRAGEILSTEDDPFAGVADGGFGLDVYEPQFADQAMELWENNKYAVEVRITDDATSEIFYFCHIHEWMSGRIVVTNADGTSRGELATPPAELYAATELNDEDRRCGFSAAPHYGDVLGPSKFGPSSGKCATLHLCGSGDQFQTCMEEIGCQMNYNMRVTHNSRDPVRTFMRQMIPHHQNAVNMAKILLKNSYEDIEEADAELGEDAFIEGMMFAIINSQNMQIMMMHDWLSAKDKIDNHPVIDLGCSKSLELPGSTGGASPVTFSSTAITLAVFACLCVSRTLGGPPPPHSFESLPVHFARR